MPFYRLRLPLYSTTSYYTILCYAQSPPPQSGTHSCKPNANPRPTLTETINYPMKFRPVCTHTFGTYHCGRQLISYIQCTYSSYFLNCFLMSSMLSWGLSIPLFDNNRFCRSPPRTGGAGKPVPPGDRIASTRQQQKHKNQSHTHIYNDDNGMAYASRAYIEILLLVVAVDARPTDCYCWLAAVDVVARIPRVVLASFDFQETWLPEPSS